MARVVTLGTAAAVPDEEHANTHLAVEGPLGFFLIDCGENVIQRIKRAGLDLDRLRGLIITHFHPDHVAGVPLMVMNTWLLGRKDPLPMYGIKDVVHRYNAMMDLYRREEWPNLFAMPCYEVPARVGALVLDDADLRITGAPVRHLVPTMGIRIEDKRGGGVLAYSSDTEPCDAVLELAKGADVLIHEAAEPTLGHSSASQAGEIARRAGVGRLVLIHYRPAPHKYDRWIEEASSAFGGPVDLARDFDGFEF